MAQQKTKVIKMFYSGQLEYVSYPANAKYEDIIDIAVERFDIPEDFKDFIQISNETTYMFEKDTFEYFILLFPNPEIIFFIRVNYVHFLGNSQPDRQPFNRLTNKRQRQDEYDHEPGAVTRQNCFIGTWPENDLSEVSQLEEPQPKRTRRTHPEKSKAVAVKKTSSKKSIRI